jgi:hypothetical protein
MRPEGGEFYPDRLLNRVDGNYTPLLFCIEKDRFDKGLADPPPRVRFVRSHVNRPEALR